MKHISDLITWKMQQYRITRTSLARSIGVSRNTMTSRLKDPSTLTLGEMMIIAKVLHVRLADLLPV